jgi:hypothetical protein
MAYELRNLALRLTTNVKLYHWAMLGLALALIAAPMGIPGGGGGGVG